MIVGLVVFHGNSSLLFTIQHVIDILSEQGHQVHLFQNQRRDWSGVQAIQSTSSSASSTQSSVHLHYFQIQSHSYEYSKQNLRDIWHIATVVAKTVPAYDVLIGVDQDAFLATWLVTLTWKVKRLVYLSMEIILNSDYAHRGRYFALKHRLEKLALRFTSQLWIQDQFRGQALVTDLGQPNYPFTIVPHSPRFLRSDQAKPTYLRDKYGLPASCQILVYTGGLDPTYHSIELGRMAAAGDSWPADTVLVMHGFGQDSVLQELKSLQNQRLIVSTQLVDFAELDELIASADVGLALFNPHLDTNHRLMTSGKIMNYLKAGIPVITTRTPTTEDVVDRHRAGVCIDQVAEVPAAFQHIQTDYSAYATAAAQAFAQEYEFERNFQAAWTKLQQSLSKRK